MQHKTPPLALAAAFAWASFSQSTDNAAQDGAGCCAQDVLDGASVGAHWIVNGPYLNSLGSADKASLKVKRVLLAGAV